MFRTSRVSAKAYAVAIGVAALAISIACGETLPPGTEPVRLPDGAIPDKANDTGTNEAGTDLDGGTDSAVDADASDDGGCSVDVPFGVAEPITNLDQLGAVRSIRLHHGGGGQAFVSRDLGSGSDFFDIVEVDFPVPTSPGSASMRSGANDEGHPAPVAGNLKLYYDEPIDAGVFRIFSATRMQAGQKLENPIVEDIPLGGATSVMHPWSVNGTNVLYVAARTTAVITNIWRIEKSGATWSTEPQITGPFEKTHPVVSDDELVMYFARNDSGKRKIHYATRMTRSSDWEAVLQVPGDANKDGFDDEPSWISPDQCTLFFVSNREGGWKGYKIERLHR